MIIHCPDCNNSDDIYEIHGYVAYKFKNDKLYNPNEESLFLTDGKRGEVINPSDLDTHICGDCHHTFNWWQISRESEA